MSIAAGRSRSCASDVPTTRLPTSHTTARLNWGSNVLTAVPWEFGRHLAPSNYKTSQQIITVPSIPIPNRYAYSAVLVRHVRGRADEAPEAPGQSLYLSPRRMFADTK